MSTAARLKTIFVQDYQVKRVNKQTDQLIAFRQKQKIGIKFVLVSNARFHINVEFPASYIQKQTGKSEVNSSLQLCISLNDDYPNSPPSIYFTGMGIEAYDILPFRNYLNVICPDWSVKYSTTDLIKMVPKFLFSQSRFKSKTPQISQAYRQYFDIDKMLSWSFAQAFIIKITRNHKSCPGLIVLLFKQFCLLQQGNPQHYFLMTDLIQYKQVSSVLKSKTHPNKFLIELKQKTRQYGIQIISEEYETVMYALIDRIRTVFPASQKDLIQQASEDQEPEQQVDFFAQEKKNPVDIQEIQQGIIVYESLLDAQMTCENVNGLVQLLKKAIQYYSAKNDPLFKVYLQKMQQLMSNEIAQVLLQSQNEDKTVTPKQTYLSIMDLQ